MKPREVSQKKDDSMGHLEYGDALHANRGRKTSQCRMVAMFDETSRFVVQSRDEDVNPIIGNI